jgi:hypothetical protein
MLMGKRRKPQAQIKEKPRDGGLRGFFVPKVGEPGEGGNLATGALALPWQGFFCFGERALPSVVSSF